MYNVLTVLLLVVMFHNMVAQHRVRCGADEVRRSMLQRHPELGRQLEEAHERIVNYERQNILPPTRNIITIPVVVHVIHDGDAIGSGENISDAQIFSQIAVLNADYRRRNADTSNTPAIFRPVAADVEVEFCLAQRDPLGNPTSGIVRHNYGQSSYTDIDMYDYVIPQTIWDRDKYLNIYTARLGGSTADLLGYSSTPGYPASTDAVVINFRYFGTTGNVQAPYNKGRTVTHEVGHWLGLLHTWGLSGGCFDDDNINDTPVSDQPYYGCPSYPQISCGSEDMFMNFMDYTNDACMNIFTKGQKNRIQSVLGSVRAFIQWSEGCLPVPVSQLDVALVQVLYPYFYACENPLTPLVEIRNNGAQTITSFYVNYQANGGILQQFHWTGYLPFSQTTYLNLPPVMFNTGPNDLLVILSSPNNGTDQNLANNEQSIFFQLSGNLQNSVWLPFFEGFEASNFPPGWALLNPNFDRTWQITNTAGGFGNSSQCAFFDNYTGTSSSNPKGKKDALITFPFNLSGSEVAQIKFNIAYARRNNSTSDSLFVYASIDCGLNWRRIYAKGGEALATAPMTASFFTPANSEWREESISLSAFVYYPSVMLKFENKSDWGNNIYLDDILIDFLPASSTEFDLPATDLEILPNPSDGRFFIRLPLKSPTDIHVYVFDIAGRVIYHETLLNASQIYHEIVLQSWEQGIYVIKVTDTYRTFSKRLMLYTKQF